MNLNYNCILSSRFSTTLADVLLMTPFVAVRESKMQLLVQSGSNLGRMTMKPLFSIALAVAGMSLIGSALAAEVDMSKLTCKEVGAMSPAKTVGVAMWVNGYVHGKAGNAMIDGEKARANAEKVADYCKENPSSTVAKAIETLAKS